MEISKFLEYNMLIFVDFVSRTSSYRTSRYWRLVQGATNTYVQQYVCTLSYDNREFFINPSSGAKRGIVIVVRGFQNPPYHGISLQLTESDNRVMIVASRISSGPHRLQRMVQPAYCGHTVPVLELAWVHGYKCLSESRLRAYLIIT